MMCDAEEIVSDSLTFLWSLVSLTAERARWNERQRRFDVDDAHLLVAPPSLISRRNILFETYLVSLHMHLICYSKRDSMGKWESQACTQSSVNHYCIISFRVTLLFSNSVHRKYEFTFKKNNKVRVIRKILYETYRHCVSSHDEGMASLEMLSSFRKLSHRSEHYRSWGRISLQRSRLSTPRLHVCLCGAE